MLICRRFTTALLKMLITCIYKCPQGSKSRPKEATATKAGVTKEKFQRTFMTRLTEGAREEKYHVIKGAKKGN